MRKIVILCCFFCSLTLSAVTMRDVLKSMPDSIMPLLTENNMLDMIDFMDSNMTAEVTNVLQGKSRMLILSEQFAKIALTQSSEVELRLLDTQEPVDSISQIICLVKTYGTDVKESRVAFYSAKWRQLNTADYLVMPHHEPYEDTMWLANWNDEEPAMTVMSVRRLNLPANEEQEKLEDVSIILNWDGRILK
jgi:hypothetical protein